MIPKGCYLVDGELWRAGRRMWSAADDETLRRRYPHEPTVTIAAALRRPVVSVYRRAKDLGLKKTAAYLASPAACRLRRGAASGDHPGSQHWFPKGHVPANKGLRRPGYARGRMRETQFQKGARPRTWVPVGTEVVDRDGYRKRKVTDDRTVASRFNWKFVHVLLWEQAHGPVPPGWNVTFVNGNRADLQLENLTLLSRRENMARNTVHHLPPDLKAVVQTLGRLHRAITLKGRHEKQDGNCAFRTP